MLLQYGRFLDRFTTPASHFSLQLHKLTSLKIEGEILNRIDTHQAYLTEKKSLVRKIA